MNIQQTGIWEMIGQEVKIRQKTVTCAPLQKLQDAFTNIMAGGEGTVDVKGRVKSDVGLSAAFGRQGCTEESGVSTALNACQAWNVAQMRRAMAAIYQRYGGGHGHDDGRSLQLLDIEMSGMPARRKGEGSTRGYFPRQKNKRGQEVGEAGIIIDRSRHNVVGPGNAIAYNLLDGISFWGHTPYNTVTKNSIHDNGGRCIEIRAPDQSMPSRRRPSTSTFRWAQFPASPCKRHSWPVGKWLPVPAPGSYFRLTVDPAWLQNRYAGHPFRPYRFGVWREGLQIKGVVIDRPVCRAGACGSALLMAYGPDLPCLLKRWGRAVYEAGGRFVHWLATPMSPLTAALRAVGVVLPLPYSRSPYYLTARPLAAELPAGFMDLRRWDCVGGDIL